MVSPGENRLVSEASQAPWPEPVYMNNRCSVRSTRFTPSKQASKTARKSGSWKSMVGRSIARRIESGMLVGPGLAKKCLPRGFLVVMWLGPSDGYVDAAFNPLDCAPWQPGTFVPAGSHRRVRQRMEFGSYALRSSLRAEGFRPRNHRPARSSERLA